jgi:hypothetical protein
MSIRATAAHTQSSTSTPDKKLTRLAVARNATISGGTETGVDGDTDADTTGPVRRTQTINQQSLTITTHVTVAEAVTHAKKHTIVTCATNQLQPKKVAQSPLYILGKLLLLLVLLLL